MGNGPLADDADFIAASAVGALAIAMNAGNRVEGDSILTEWVREVGQLPSWRDDAGAWTRGLYAIQKKYNLPSDAELSSRTIEQSLFNRVRSSALDAVMSGDMRARHFHLSMASIAAGSLLGIAHGPGAQAAIDVAVAAALSGNAGRANSKRKKVLAMNEVREKFNDWQKEPGKYPEWRFYKDFGRWAEDSHGLDAASVARKAGRWAREKIALTRRN